jgi:hypothetical protein
MTKLYNEMRIQNIRKGVNDGQRSEAKDDNRREHVKKPLKRSDRI